MLLAIDTSTRNTSIALYDGTQVLSEAMWVSNFHHTITLAPTIAKALEHIGENVEAIKALAVAIGPGSFTSLRTGLAYAKGMALARRIPIVGIPSLDILVAGQPTADMPLAAVLVSGRRRLAVGWYEAVDGTWQPSGNPELLSPEDLSQRIQEPTLICGELDAKARAVLKRKWKNAHLASPAWSSRRAGYLAELGWNRWQAGETDDPIQLAPIYLSHASM